LERLWLLILHLLFFFWGPPQVPQQPKSEGPGE
jgi:hypothetical protein